MDEHRHRPLAPNVVGPIAAGLIVAYWIWKDGFLQPVSLWMEEPASNGFVFVVAVILLMLMSFRTGGPVK